MDQQTRMDSQRVGAIMLAVALLAPAGLVAPTDIRAELGLIALLWYVGYTPEYGTNILLSPFYNPSFFQRPEQVPFFILMSFASFVPRFVFVYQMTRRYKGLSTDKWTLFVGVISESLFIAIFALNVITALVYTFSTLSITIPIPTLFLSGFALLKYRPAPESEVQWKELEVSTWTSSRDSMERIR